MNNELIAVLDLGSTKAACLAVKESSKGLEAVALATVPCNGLRRGVVTEIEAAASSIDKAVRKVEQEIGQSVPSLVVGVAGSHLESIDARGLVPIYPTGREITRDDLLQVMNHSRHITLPEDREQIQALPKEFRVDGQASARPPLGRTGSKLEVSTCLITGKTTHVESLEKAIAMAGKGIDMVVLQPLASGLGVLAPQEMDVGCAVVDIGGGTTDVAIFSNGSIISIASLPIGGQLVTADISKLLKTSPEEAERLKIESATATSAVVGPDETAEVLQLGQTHTRPMQRRVLCEIVESRMRELAQAVKHQIERAGLGGKLPGGIVLTGGGSRMTGIEKLFEGVMPQTRIRMGAPRLGGKLATAVDVPEMATAIGLARFALECADDELATAAGAGNWKERIRTFWSLVSVKA